MFRPTLPDHRAPLRPAAFQALPLSAIEARGWLRNTLINRTHGMLSQRTLLRYSLFLVLALVGLVFSACAPPPEMIATLTQLPLTPTREKPTLAATITPRSTHTIAPLEGAPSPGTPGSAGIPTPEPGQPTVDPNRAKLPSIDQQTGEVIIEGQVVFNTEQESPGCTLHRLSFSPTYEHFLVIPACPNGKNPGVLFRIDGSERKEISGKDEHIQDGIHAWSPDGQNVLFFRNHSEQGEANGAAVPGAPPPGLMIFDVSGGDKRMILNAEENPDLGYPSRLRWSPDGKIIAFVNYKAGDDKSEINLIYPDGSEWQILDEFSGAPEQNTLEWTTLDGGNYQLEYRDPDGKVIRSYPIAP